LNRKGLALLTSGLLILSLLPATSTVILYELSLDNNAQNSTELKQYSSSLIETISINDSASVKLIVQNDDKLNKNPNGNSLKDVPKIYDSVVIIKTVIISEPISSYMAIPERISDRPKILKSPISKTFSSLYLLNHQTENPIENDIKIEVAAPILASINSVNSFDVTIPQSVEIISDISYDFPTISSDIINIQTEDWNNLLPALILLPVAGLAVRSYENKKNLPSLFWLVISWFTFWLVIS